VFRCGISVTLCLPLSLDGTKPAFLLPTSTYERQDFTFMIDFSSDTTLIISTCLAFRETKSRLAPYPSVEIPLSPRTTSQLKSIDVEFREPLLVWERLHQVPVLEPAVSCSDFHAKFLHQHRREGSRLIQPTRCPASPELSLAKWRCFRLAKGNVMRLL
jgi:hypothetical protein